MKSCVLSIAPIVAVTAADTRSRTELEEMLGAEFAGVHSSDDYSVCNGYAIKHQPQMSSSFAAAFQEGDSPC